MVQYALCTQYSSLSTAGCLRTLAAATSCHKRTVAATQLFEHLPGAPYRPFAWRGQLWLAHWIIFAPGEERMAISAVDEATGLVRLVHVLSPLPARVEAAQHVDGNAGAEEAESLSAVQGSSFAREKCAPAHGAPGQLRGK